MDPENQRLKELIALLKKKRAIRSQEEFCELIDTNPTIVSGLVQGKRKLSKQFIDKVCVVFKEINGEWILNGDEPMLLYPILNRISLISEDHKEFGKPKNDSECAMCIEKDARIKDKETSLRDKDAQIEVLNGQIKFLQHIIETQCLGQPPLQAGTGPP